MQTIEPPLFSHPVTTEYRKEFAWKEPLKRELRHVIPVSDISKDGEQSSDPNEKASKLKSFKTEYQLQFKEYPLSREPPNIAKISSNLKENHKESESAIFLYLMYVVGQDQNEALCIVLRKGSLSFHCKASKIFSASIKYSFCEEKLRDDFALSALCLFLWM